MPPPKTPVLLWSRAATIAVIGFLLNLVGAIGGALYLDPARRAAEAASLEIVLQSARSRIILAATAFDELAEHMGSLVFGISLPPDAPDEVAAAIHDLRARALDRRHDGVRGFIAELGVAGALDYPETLREYEALVAAEHANFTIDTYRAANAFEADLATRMVKAQGEAATKAITLQRDHVGAKKVAFRRSQLLLLVSLAGSAIVFLATMAGAERPPPAPNARTRVLTIALRRLRANNAESRDGAP
jgi:hypothetical protein